MKFGIFYEHQLPRPWTSDSEYELLQHSLDQIELADRLGYDYAWEVEHHFLEEYCHSSAPEVFLAAASQRTKQHPARARHRPAHHQPPGARGRAGAPRSTWSQPRPRRARARRGVEHHRAASLRRAASATSARCGRTPCARCIPMFWDDGVGVPRRALRLPAAQRPAQAAARSRIRRCGWRARSSRRSRWPAAAAWARWASSSCRPRRRRRGSTPTTTPSPAARAARATTRRTRTSRSCAVHVRADRRGGVAQGRRLDLLPVRARLLRQPRPGRAGQRRTSGTSTRRAEDTPAGQKLHARRPDRLARHDPGASCASSRSPTSTR